MRLLLTFVAMLSIFYGGVLFLPHPAVAALLLGAGMVLAGFCYASAETHGFEGRYVAAKHPPYRWESLWLDVVRLPLGKGKATGTEPIYVATDKGTVPLTGIFSARVNHEMSIVLDTSAPLVQDGHAAHWNAIKQGVM